MANLKNYPNPGMPERRGLIGDADGSTLFLDELGELPETIQAHLLRVLDAGGEYQRLGDSRTQRSAFRLIAATNRQATELKADLAARLTHRLEIPALRERREDIPLLVRHLLSRAAADHQQVKERFFEDGDPLRPRISPALMTALLMEPLPLNVRQLDTLLWTALRTSTGNFLDLTEELKAELDSASEPEGSAKVMPGEAEIRDALARCGGNQVQAARELGLSSRFVLYRLMRKLGVSASQPE